MRPLAAALLLILVGCTPPGSAAEVRMQADAAQGELGAIAFPA
jgi:hypothetical protein